MTAARGLRYGLRMNSPSHPTPDASDPIDTLLREIDALPVSRDPVGEWTMAHAEELRAYTGQDVAIDPAVGIVAHDADPDALYAKLRALGRLYDENVTIVPVHG